MQTVADTEVTALARQTAHIVKQQGQRGFVTVAQDGRDVMTASLCGMTVYFTDDVIMRLTASDMDIVITPVDQPESKPFEMRYKGVEFQKGSTEQLDEWHSRLNRLQTVFITSEE